MFMSTLRMRGVIVKEGATGQPAIQSAFAELKTIPSNCVLLVCANAN